MTDFHDMTNRKYMTLPINATQLSGIIERNVRLENQIAMHDAEIGRICGLAAHHGARLFHHLGHHKRLTIGNRERVDFASRVRARVGQDMTGSAIAAALLGALIRAAVSALLQYIWSHALHAEAVGRVGQSLPECSPGEFGDA